MKVIEIKNEVVGIYLGELEPALSNRRAIHRILVPQAKGCGEHYCNFPVNKKSEKIFEESHVNAMIRITPGKGGNLKIDLIEEE